MTDNSSVPVAVGNETFANNDIGGVKYPRNKLTWGPAGTANDADVATGKPLPVQLRGSDGTDRSNLLPVSLATAPVLVAGAAIIGKVGIDQTTDGTTNAVHLVAGTAIAGKVGIDQTTDGTTNKVAADVRLGGVAAATGSGVMGTGVQRMALATDSPGIIGTAALTAATAPTTAIATLGQYNATNPAPTDTQTVALQLDPNGKLLVAPYGNPANFVSGAITTAMTGITSTSLVAAPAAGLRNYITTIICSNSHATVGTDIIIQDGSGGTTLLTIPAAAVYGGAVITLPTPLRQPTTATALFCANVTTGASTKVSAVGYKGA